MDATQTFNQLMQRREDLLTAERTGLTVEQVETLNRYRASEVEKQGTVVFATISDDNDWDWSVAVRADGSIDWTCNGAFPELAKWNR